MNYWDNHLCKNCYGRTIDFIDENGECIMCRHNSLPPYKCTYCNKKYTHNDQQYNDLCNKCYNEIVSAGQDPHLILYDIPEWKRAFKKYEMLSTKEKKKLAKKIIKELGIDR